MVRLTPAFKTLSFFTLFATTLSADVFYTFNIQNANIAPDGFTRAAVTVNGVFPGTLIQATKNDVLHITVNNQLTNPNMRRSTSIHWHGLFQGRTASEDRLWLRSAPLLRVTRTLTIVRICICQTRCICDTSLIEMTPSVPLNGQSGTHWYHSHLSSQYVDGLRGTIVVYDPTDPHAALYDEDNANTVIQLGDWYHLAAPGIQATYMAGNHEPVPDSGTINGIGRYVGGPSVTRARVNVVQGKKYRLRIVNISAYGSFLFSVESHKLTIIEVDGVNHVAKTVDGFNIYAGQRYSAVLHANQPVRNYWIRAPMDLQHHSDNDNLDEEDVYAVLHYDGAPNAQPSTRADRDPDDVLQEYQLAPLENPGPPGGSGPADRVIDLEFSRSTSGGTKWMFNGIQYHSPNIPTLLKIMSGATLPSDFATTEHTLVLNHNEVVELHLHGSANGHDHPFHLHGHAFDVIQGNSGPANYVNPPRRDVVAIKGGTGIIRFRADNPGPWFLHCHIDWHLEAGLAVVFAEAPAEQRSGPTAQIIKQEWLDLCPIYDALPAALQ